LRPDLFFPWNGATKERASKMFGMKTSDIKSYDNYWEIKEALQAHYNSYPVDSKEISATQWQFRAALLDIYFYKNETL
ncbi:hypothetical protein WDZ92_01425, partial [Nostoc sp. NIES-2111]